MSLIAGLLCAGLALPPRPAIQILGQRSDGETNIKTIFPDGTAPQAFDTEKPVRLITRQAFLMLGQPSLLVPTGAGIYCATYRSMLYVPSGFLAVLTMTCLVPAPVGN